MVFIICSSEISTLSFRLSILGTILKAETKRKKENMSYIRYLDTVKLDIVVGFKILGNGNPQVHGNPSKVPLLELSWNPEGNQADFHNH